ncbi:MAG: hypothetical protein A3D67_04475 [Candidatus Lloydbacteria bacterium RIFCSPHIGHO2_02_FULL_51_22]|uniref:Uncharacterized protein n=3 Tax=Candidatus Lloydiibacteriota TaxID=1817910 RepID=A0A1G2D9X7_9BACT|nr:MAG: hypothetical protein A3D67_04475 [Candidatus Lloydbacteria bacterium RIFCSPHIGHO2_02_FULL_51_22]OGZ15635.1 MAG: hypothetical protein A3J08_00360 [Candidatus Lloydbacteria bacterium RIFCSPLOWO2_02_FULL_51_11]OGZ15974.1 MAG: hypothetical protein A3G11_01295 [Candidatus Lloydbacteria bacterium RIFCSPLOWO2_12_FULL_51_9]
MGTNILRAVTALAIAVVSVLAFGGNMVLSAPRGTDDHAEGKQHEHHAGHHSNTPMTCNGDFVSKETAPAPNFVSGGYRELRTVERNTGLMKFVYVFYAKEAEPDKVVAMTVTPIAIASNEPIPLTRTTWEEGGFMKTVRNIPEMVCVMNIVEHNGVKLDLGHLMLLLITPAGKGT